MRADAQKNRQRLIAATIELVLEVGGEPSRDAVADRAGVGIGTLYRHFPDQQSLLHAAARHVLEESIGAGEALIETVPHGVDALRQYMHLALDKGIGVVNIIHPLLEKRDWPDLLARAATLMKALVGGAVQEGSLRSDLSERDIVFALIRFARPLAVGLPANEERALAHRHLDFYIDGLCAETATPRSRRMTGKMLPSRLLPDLRAGGRKARQPAKYGDARQSTVPRLASSFRTTPLPLVSARRSSSGSLTEEGKFNAISVLVPL